MTETLRYLDEHGTLSSACKHKPSTEVLLKGYQTMLLERHIDERMITLQRQGLITFALSSLGEEGCSVAAAAALDFQDWIYPQYRESGVMFWRGCTPLQYIHGMFGDREDLGKGRQMPNHFGSRALNVVTVSSPIGTKIPHAAGAAYAMKLQKDPQIAVVFFGEGATSEGDFHAGLNFAAVRQAPCLFFCRNNGYAISTKTDHQFRSEGIAPKGIGYGIEAFRVDGNDFFAVYATVAKARELCLQGKGPILIEAMTYRRGAHSTSDDPTAYRKHEEEDLWSQKDPILRLKKYLMREKLWTEDEDVACKQQIDEQVTEAIRNAKNTPKPFLKTLVEDVYFEIPDTLQEQFDEVRRFFPEE